MATVPNPLEQALGLHRAGRLDAALAAYRGLLPANPDHPELLFLIGTASAQAGQRAQALEFLQRATRCAPERPEPWRQLASVQAELG